MRFYNITITPPLEDPTRFTAFTYSSQSGLGDDNYSSLRVDLDIFQNAYHQYASNGFIKVWGIDLKALGQVANLNPTISADGKTCLLYTSPSPRD